MKRTRTLATAVLALTILAGTADPVRGDERQQSLLDQLDDARINRDLQEMEVAADKAQIQKMMTVLRETELMPMPGVPDGLTIGGRDPEQRAANLVKYKQKLDHLCADFVIKSKELSRRQRRVAELEAKLGVTAAAPWAGSSGPAHAPRSLADAERVLDFILRGVESWQRSNPAPDERASPPLSPAPAPEDRPLMDAERLLDLLRRGIESWRGTPSAPPEKRPEPGSEPDQRLRKDAEQLLDLLRRGVESWQGR